MARRTVTATFAGGMISDEPKPGTARYLENFVPRADGILPIQNGNYFYRSATGISGGSTFSNNNILHGWSAGGTIHHSIGFVGLIDVVNTTAATTGSAWANAVTGFGLAGTPSGSAHRALVGIPDVRTAEGIGNPIFADHGSFCPVVQDTIGTATGTASFVSAVRQQKLNGLQTFISTEQEILVVGRHSSAAQQKIIRYAGSTADMGIRMDSTTYPSAVGSATGWAAPTASATWTRDLTLYAEVANVVTATGCYVGLIMGEGLTTGTAAPVQHTVHSFLVTAVSSITGSGNTATRKISIDRKIYFASATRYARCIVGNTAQLLSNQVARGTAAQPFSEPSYSGGGGWANSEHLPAGADGACYHHGRLFLLNGHQLSWSGSVDEQIKTTATGNFATGTASTSVTTASSTTYGIEHTHLNLYDTNGCLDVFPHIGGDGVGLVSDGDSLLILKRGSMFRLVGSVSYDGASNALDLQIISSQVGPDSMYSWCETQQGIIFTQGHRIWVFNGTELQDISNGTISQQWRDDNNSHRMGNTIYSKEPVVSRVTSDGERVFFTPMRYTLSTSTSDVEPALTLTGSHRGYSIYNRHLVLSLSDLKWFYITMNKMFVPSNILPVRSNRGGMYSRYWLNSSRTDGVAEGQHTTASISSMEIVDTLNLFHENGISENASTYGSTSWSSNTIVPYQSVLIGHPLVGEFDCVRPVAMMMKRTTVSGNNSSSTFSLDSQCSLDSLGVIESAASYNPTSLYTGSMVPGWWDEIAVSSVSRAAKPDTSNWHARRMWNVDGSTSTSRAISQVDRFPLTQLEGAMYSPSIVFLDRYLYRDGNSLWFQINLIQAMAVEFEDVENRTDR